MSLQGVAGAAVSELMIEGISMLMGGGLGMEGICLLGAKMVTKKEPSTLLKVAKKAFVTFALLGAFVTTLAVGVLLSIVLIPYLPQNGIIHTAKMGLLLGSLISSIVCLPFHRKAFQ